MSIITNPPTVSNSNGIFISTGLGGSAGSAAFSPASANVTMGYMLQIPYWVTTSQVIWFLNTADATGTDLYDLGIYNLAGKLLADIGPTAMNISTGVHTTSWTQGKVTFAPGIYIFATTGEATTAKIELYTSANFIAPFSSTNPLSGNATTGGQLLSSLTPGLGSLSSGSWSVPYLVLA